MAVLVVFVALVVLQSVCAAPSSVAVYSTVPLDPSVRLSPQPSLSVNKSCPSDLPTLTISTTQQQPLLGFGAALTETTAYNFALLKQRNESAYNELLVSLFAPSPAGIGISFLRVPITSSDLSLPTPGWSYDDTTGDLDLQHFNTSHGEAYQIPILQDIMALSSQYGTQLRLLGSPWSAPAWIKDSKAWGHGTIEDQYYDWYASYFVKLIQTFDSLGLPLYAITLQNEPRYEPYSYPGTRLTPQNESALANILKPLLRAANLSTLVAAYDHNWDLVQYPLDVMAGAADSVDVMAFHCYAGGPENQTVFHEAYPDTPIWFTECSQVGNENTPRQFLNDFTDNLNGIYFGNIDNWGRTVTHWSLAVNASFGPHSGGCGTCSGVVTVDVPSSGAYTVKRNNEYYTLGHFASFIPPGSVKLATSQTGAGSWLGMAVQTASSGRVVQLLNNDDSAVQLVVLDQSSGGCFTTTVEAQSLSTYVWSNAASTTVSASPTAASTAASTTTGTGTAVSTAASSGSGGGGTSDNGAGVTGRATAVVCAAVAGLIALLCL